MSQTPKSNQNGFSLVEIIVAMMVLSFGLLAMAASTGYVFNQLRSTSWDSHRMLAKQEMVEQLRGMFWTDIPTTTAATTTIGQYSMSYLATMPTTFTKRVRIITSGPGYRMGTGTQTTVVDTTTVVVTRPQ